MRQRVQRWEVELRGTNEICPNQPVDDKAAAETLKHRSYNESIVFRLNSEFGRLESLLEVALTKINTMEFEYNITIAELKRNYLGVAERYEEQLKLAKVNESKLEERIAAKVSDYERKFVTLQKCEADSKRQCEDYETLFHDLRCENKDFANKYKNLLADNNKLQKTIISVEQREKESQDYIKEQEVISSTRIQEIEDGYEEKLADFMTELEKVKMQLHDSNAQMEIIQAGHSTADNIGPCTEKTILHTKVLSIKHECSKLR